jgi:hypothetical protein
MEDGEFSRNLPRNDKLQKTSKNDDLKYSVCFAFLFKYKKSSPPFYKPNEKYILRESLYMLSRQQL